MRHVPLLAVALAELERRLHLERVVLELRVTFGPSGAASLVEVPEDSVHDADVRACAYWNLRDAGYPQNMPGRYAFTFAFGR